MTHTCLLLGVSLLTPAWRGHGVYRSRWGGRPIVGGGAAIGDTDGATRIPSPDQESRLEPAGSAPSTAVTQEGTVPRAHPCQVPRRLVFVPSGWRVVISRGRVRQPQDAVHVDAEHTAVDGTTTRRRPAHRRGLRDGCGSAESSQQSGNGPSSTPFSVYTHCGGENVVSTGSGGMPSHPVQPRAERSTGRVGQTLIRRGR